MKIKIISFFILFAVISGIVGTTPFAFAGNSEVTITPDANLTVTLDLGGKVIFSNTGSTQHGFMTLDPNTAAGTFSPVLEPGETYEWTPPVAGEYQYRCPLHPNDTGLIIVQGDESGYDEYDTTSDIPDIPAVPGMEDFEIPSQEEIKAMMESKEVSGKYSNSEHGVEVTFPTGWSGMESDFKEPGTDNRVTSVAVMEGGMQENMNAMQKGEFRIIALSIIDKTDDKPPEFEPPTLDEDKEYDFDCKIISSEKTKVNNMNTFKSTIECSGDDSSMKGKSHHFATNDKWIMLMYASSPSSDFDKDVSSYDSAVSTLNISNTIDFDFELPEDLKGSSESNMASTTSTEEVSSIVPAWVKNNAGWWSAGDIDDNSFVQGIQFLIQQEILEIPAAEQSSENVEPQEIPSWVKNNAGWWADGLISESDFLSGIQFLIKSGIIQV